MISIDMMLPEDELEELYKEIISNNVEQNGITIDEVKYLVCKKIREEDKEV